MHSFLHHHHPHRHHQHHHHRPHQIPLHHNLPHPPHYPHCSIPCLYSQCMAILFYIHLGFLPLTGSCQFAINYYCLLDLLELSIVMFFVEMPCRVRCLGHCCCPYCLGTKMRSFPILYSHSINFLVASGRHLYLINMAIITTTTSIIVRQPDTRIGRMDSFA